MGGLHSVNKPERFEFNDNTHVFDDDVTSLYPSIVIQNNIYPKHLGPAFVKVYKQIRDERVEAKNSTVPIIIMDLSERDLNFLFDKYQPNTIYPINPAK